MKYTAILKSNGLEIGRLDDLTHDEAGRKGELFVKDPKFTSQKKRGFTVVPFGLDTAKLVTNALEVSGLSSTAVAKLLGVRVATVSEWKNGVYSMRLNEFLKMCNLLGLSPEQLIY